MIAIFSDGDEVFVVGLDRDYNPIDEDGTLFGPDSGRDVNDFMRVDINTDNGEVGHIELVSNLVVSAK